MSRKYLNDRWCVRCGRLSPTPYLLKCMKLLPKTGKVLDVGCGNGRNSKHMAEKGYEVVSLDMAGDYGIKMTLGKDQFPKGKFDVILANYVLMFLNEAERQTVMEQIDKASKEKTVLMVEVYAAKDAFPCDISAVVEWFSGRGWVAVRKEKERCVLEKRT